MAATIDRAMRKARRLATYGRVFRNPNTYDDAMKHRGEGTVVLRPWRGPELEVRRNIEDAKIVHEIFFDKPYLQGVTLPPSPTIVDVGGYIGDFTLYAAALLDARVVVYEPTLENFEMLQRNIARNHMEDRITAVNEAVGAGGTLTLNVEVNGSEVHASVYKHEDAPKREVPCVTLQNVLARHALGKVDLLKVDCEGGEYELFDVASDEALATVDTIVLEVHAMGERTRSAQQALRERLQAAGFSVPAFSGETEVVTVTR